MGVIRSFVSVVVLVGVCACSSSSPPKPVDLELSSFSFETANNASLSTTIVGQISDTTVVATVPFGTDVTHLVATFASNGAGVAVADAEQTSGVSANDFTSPVTYVVSGAGTTTRNFTVVVIVALPSDKDITDFWFLPADNSAISADVTATIQDTSIAATVPFGTVVTHLVARFSSTGERVTVEGVNQSSGVTANDFTTPVTYTVTAANGTTRDFTMTLTVRPSPAKDITSFAFKAANNSELIQDSTATINGTQISIIIYPSPTTVFGTAANALVATFATTGTGVAVSGTSQVSGTTANNFTSPVTYTVTAADGTTKDYVVTVLVVYTPDAGPVPTDAG